MANTATYSAEDNKLRLYPASRMDEETYSRVKAAGFSWAPKQELFVAGCWTPEREDLLLDLCDEIDDEDTTMEERAAIRAERFEGYSEKRGAEADSAHKYVETIANGIPLGQPILRGHHSEKHARKDAERIENGMRKAVRLWDTAKYWESRAERVQHHAAYKANPRVRANRIKTLEADKRRHQREIKEVTMRRDLWRKVLLCEGAELQRAAALKVANHYHGGEMWSRLERGEATAVEIAQKALASADRIEIHAQRWIAHLDNRLAYERVLLGRRPDEETKVDRTRKGSAALPLLNYQAGSILLRNRWREGVDPFRQVSMTSAEYQKTYDDDRGTRVSADGTHRVRILILKAKGYGMGGEWVAVFLTDSKAHPVPMPKAPAPEPTVEEVEAEIAAEEAERAEADETEPSAPQPVVVVEPEPAPVNHFEAMRATLKSGGVKAIAVPQLFETPAPLAARVVEAAHVGPGDLVLEPEAGLGAIADAVRVAGGTVVCVEINHHAVEHLRSRGFSDVRHADFLDLRPEGFPRPVDRVAQNPPFADQQDVRHVVHAMRFLRIGGTLAAVMCANVETIQNKLAVQFRAFVRAHGGTIEALPEGSFVASGTGTSTVLVTMTRAAAAAVPSLPVLLPDGWSDPAPTADALVAKYRALLGAT